MIVYYPDPMSLFPAEESAAQTVKLPSGGILILCRQGGQWSVRQVVSTNPADYMAFPPGCQNAPEQGRGNGA
jgi:hypothetical protein